MKERSSGSRAVLAAGTILTRGTPVYDLVNGTVLKATAESPLVIPENAVVVPGSRAVTKGKGAEWGLSVYTPVIVKYRDEKTELSAPLLKTCSVSCIQLLTRLRKRFLAGFRQSLSFVDPRGTAVFLPARIEG